MHTWSFFRAGGFDQVRLDTGADLAALDELDQKLWVALACPTTGLEFDERTLQLVDADGDGRIRAPDLVAAAKWATSLLRNPDDLVKGSPSLPLAAIDDGTDEGRRVLAAAKRILTDLGKPEATEITVDDTTDTARIFASTRFNGDGVVPPDAASDPETHQLLCDVIACFGATPDRSGKDGVDREKLTAFFEAAAEFVAWHDTAAADPAILPLGEATAAADEALVAVAAKVEDFFARVRLAAFDPRATEAVNTKVEVYEALGARQLTNDDEAVSRLPLAPVAAGASLPLGPGVNPAWVEAVVALRDRVVVPLLGPTDVLTEEGWKTCKARLAPYEAWKAAAAGTAVAPLGVERVRAYLASDVRQRVEALLAEDEALAPEADAIATVDRLVRYHRDLVRLLKNFVSFEEFYGRRSKAIFQVGTLIVDQRSTDLVLRVEDPAKHAQLASLSGAYLCYCDVVRRSTGEKMAIVAAITGGDADNLMVGRNGLFYDRKGRDWDATIVKIVENPIGLRQAFWAPYKRLARFVAQQIEKFAAERDAAVDASAQEGVAATVSHAQEGKRPDGGALPFDPGKYAGIFAAVGLALAAVGTTVGYVVQAVLSLAWWQIPLAVIGAMLVISGPSVIMAWLKLRERNLAPLLDANGWAVNAHAKINLPFGESLTRLATLPSGARRSLHDPYAEDRTKPRLALAGAVVALLLWALWSAGLLSPDAAWLQPAADPAGTGAASEAGAPAEP